MKIVVIAAAAILVLGGIGAGGYFYFSKTAQASVAEPGHEKEEKAHAKKGKGGHGEGGHVSQFVTLDPLILPIIDQEGVSQMVSIVISLEVGDEEKAKEVTAYAPRLKDAYIQDMYGILNKQAALAGGVVQVGMIKERLTTISKRVMGEGIVDEVLLQVVQQRQM